MSKTLSTSKVAILDAGAQYGKVIDRRVRELKLESELLPLETRLEKLTDYAAIIISGGPDSVYAPRAPKADPRLFNKSSVPVLGICYGMQLMNYEREGKVQKGSRREDGPSSIRINKKSRLFEGLQINERVLMSHGDSVSKIPEGFQITAYSGNIIAAIEKADEGLFGVQFHPEVDLTPHGKVILKNFLFKVAKCTPNYTIENRERKAIAEIKKVVGKKHVLILVSGGVDSSVCATLVKKALPQKQIHAFHIDTGFMRKNESTLVKKALEKQGLKLHIIDASRIFREALQNITDPEQKRHKIGDLYIECTNIALEEKNLSKLDLMIAQGTLRPDLIESASSIVSSKAQTIKTHHNDAPLVRKMRAQGKILEPLKDYHKDEVRLLGKKLGLPRSLTMRQPFPGPGLAIRIICSSSDLQLDGFSAIARKLEKYSSPVQALNLLPVKSVGVQGDERSYKYVAAIQGKAHWNSFLKLANELPKNIHEINRVVYVLTPNLGQMTQISITETYLTNETISQLQQADHIVNMILQKNRLTSKLSQMPVILIPVSFGTPGSRSIVLRPFLTNDFMTGLPAKPGSEAMPIQVLSDMAKQITNRVPGISAVLYDLSSKPPGTTEWE